MGVVIGVDLITCPETAGDQVMTVSAGGLTPKAVEIYLLTTTAFDTDTSHCTWTYGAATASDEQWSYGFRSDNGSTPNCRTWRATDEILQVRAASTGALTFEASFVSFGPNTVTINWSTTQGAAYHMLVVTYSGTSVSALAGVSTVSGTVNVETDIDTIGFEPDIVKGGVPAITTPDTIGVVGINCSVGMCHNDGIGGVTQNLIMWGERDQVAGSILGINILGDDTGFAADKGGDLGSIRCKYDLESFDADGFSVYPRIAGAGGYDLHYLALKFDGYASWVGNYDTPTSEGDDTFTDPGFKPQFVFFHNTMMHAYGQNWGAESGPRGMSAITANNQYSMSFSAKDNSNPASTWDRMADSALYLSDQDKVETLTASFVNFEATGWKLNYSSVHANAKHLFALAIEEDVRVTAGLPIYYRP